MDSFPLIALFCLHSFWLSSAVQITGWVYADNWFELYFNGQKVATDPLNFYPHNAVYINFTAPDAGTYSFAFEARDFANDSTGLEPRITPNGDFGGWCVGDGGIRMALSDGTETNSQWICKVIMEGPYESGCTGECIDKNTKPTDCTVQYNNPPSCWNESVCAEAVVSSNGWVYATEYTQGDIGWGRAPNKDTAKFGYTYPEICNGEDAQTADDVYVSEGCSPQEIFGTWGTNSVPIWTGDLDFDNRIVCRYSYCVAGDCDTNDVKQTMAPNNRNNDATKVPTVNPTFTGTNNPTYKCSCKAFYFPVCCDNTTYSNSCYASCLGGSGCTYGECSDKSKGFNLQNAIAMTIIFLFTVLIQ